MVPRRNVRRQDRIHIGRETCARAGSSSPRSHIPWVTAVLFVAGALSLLWGLSRWVQASSGETQETDAPRATAGAPSSATEPVGSPVSVAAPAAPTGSATTGPVQGPAMEVPREILDMLDLRKKELDRREETLRAHEERLMVLKADIEQILTKYEQMADAAEKRRTKEKAQLTKAEQERKVQEEKRAAELREAQQKALAKMYEAMEPEEAAARLEKLPDRTAVAILRLLKGKTAGAILAQVKPARAAKLTEQLLATP